MCPATVIAVSKFWSRHYQIYAPFLKFMFSRAQILTVTMDTPQPRVQESLNFHQALCTLLLQNQLMPTLNLFS